MKTLKILNKLSKIVVTKLKINTVLCEDCFFFSPRAHETSLHTLGQYMKCPTQHGASEERVSEWWLKSLESGNPLHLFAVAKC